MSRLVVAFFLSGAAGLMYQVIWSRLLILVFGSTTIAVSTVLTVFMGGLALGALVGGRWIDRVRRPLIVYALIEICVAASALVIPTVLDQMLPVYQVVWRELSDWPGALLATRFGLIALILIVPTTLMGATLPVLGRAVASGNGPLAGRIGLLYAVNTAGAIAGAWTSGFVLLPVWGVTSTIRAAALCNLAAAVAAWSLTRTRDHTADGPAVSQAAFGAPPPTRLSRWVAVTLGVSGAVALVNEVVWSRALSLVLGSSVYAFTSMLTTFLIGLAAGAAAGVWLVSRIGSGLALLGVVQLGIAACSLLTVGLLAYLPFALIQAARAFAEFGPGAIPMVQFGLSFGVMLLPTLGFGVVFPIALHLLVRDPRAVGWRVGRLYAINTAGAIAGAFLAGFVLVPRLGVQHSLLLAVGVSLALGWLLLIVDPTVPRRRVAGIGLAVAAAAGLAVFALPPWNAMVMSSGVYWNLPRYVALSDRTGPQGLRAKLVEGRTLYEREGLTATVLVQRDPDGQRLLTINGRTESGDPFMRTQVLIAHWPLWLARSRDRVLVIGLGSGATAGSVLRHPVRRLDVVELEAAILEASRFFEPENGRPLADPRTRAAAADGRNFLLLSGERYDVVISQPSLPWVAGAATLFTEEFFAIAASRLAPGGVFGQWVTADGMGADPLRSVMAAFTAVFPYMVVVEPTPGDLLLIGSQTPLMLDPARLVAAFVDPTISADLRRVDVFATDDLYRMVLGNGATLRPLLAGAVPNRDENVYVEFSGPRAFAGLLTGRRERATAWIPRDQGVLVWRALAGSMSPLVGEK
jgi:spermidine synthase